MPQTTVNTPDGPVIVNHPDGATDEQILRFAKNQVMAGDSTIVENAAAPEKPLVNRLGRQAGLLARMPAEAFADLLQPFTGPLTYGANKALEAVGSEKRLAPLSAATSGLLDKVLPAPEGPEEQFTNAVGRFGLGVVAGGGLDKAVVKAVGKVPPNVKLPSRGTLEASEVLSKEGVPLSLDQKTGNKLLARYRSSAGDNPLLANKLGEFYESQSKAYTKAVLRTIGESSEEATQDVMEDAANAIGKRIDDVAKGVQTKIDDQFLDILVKTVKDADLAGQGDVIRKNVDNLFELTRNGEIPGAALVAERSRLSGLRRDPQAGVFFQKLHDGLLDALERSASKDARQSLQKALNQWRSYRIIEGSLGKGTDKYISPLQLSNSIATIRNRAMSVRGLGGDQKLVKLAQAGRQLLGDQLPNSGTAPRLLSQNLVKTVVHSIPERMLQNRNLPPGNAFLEGLLRGEKGVSSAGVPFAAGLLADPAIDEFRAGYE